MKQHIINFFKSVWKLIVTFFISIVVVFISSNTNNIVYIYLDRFNFSVDQKKAVLVALVTVCIGLIELLLFFLKKLFLWMIQKLLKKLKIEIEFSGADNSTNIIDNQLDFYQLRDKSFKENKLKVLLTIHPAGDLTMIILKMLKLRVEIFFNPEQFDITLDNDREWSAESEQPSVSTYVNKEQAVCINILNDYRLDSNDRKPFDIEEIIYVMPKVYLKKTSIVDYSLGGSFIKKPFKIFCVVNIDSFTTTRGGRL